MTARPDITLAELQRRLAAEKAITRSQCPFLKSGKPGSYTRIT